jgi:hypothetical protein
MSAAKPPISVTIKDETITISQKTIQNAIRIAIEEDRPLLWDYMLPSLNGKAHIGVRRTKKPDGTFAETGEKLLVKSSEEYTSNITKTFKCDTEFIVLTENSIYIISTSINTVFIS